jgi:hypothetical protein
MISATGIDTVRMLDDFGTVELVDTLERLHTSLPGVFDVQSGSWHGWRVWVERSSFEELPRI